MKKHLLSILLLALMGCNAFCGTKKALTVFIGDYPTDSGWNKIASQNDKSVVLNMLYSLGFETTDITVLEESGATYNSIISALSDLSAKACSGDRIYIHFSCHGQQITDQDGDEALLKPGDKLDEAIVPYDAAVAYNWHGYKGDKHLTDDILNGYFSKIQKAVGQKGSLVVVYDACHSGDVDRDSVEKEYPSFRGSYDAFNQPLKARSGNPSTREVFWISISACKDFQTNFEVCIEGRMYGRLSYAISRCLKSGMSAQALAESLAKEYDILPMPDRKHQSLQYYIPEKLDVKQLF